MKNQNAREYVKEFGQRVKFFRKRLGLSQRELAEKSHISVNTIAQLERGIKNPTLGTIMTVCSALGITPTELFTLRTDKVEDELQREINCVASLMTSMSVKNAHRLVLIVEQIIAMLNW